MLSVCLHLPYPTYSNSSASGGWKQDVTDALKAKSWRMTLEVRGAQLARAGCVEPFLAGGSGTSMAKTIDTKQPGSY